MWSVARWGAALTSGLGFIFAVGWLTWWLIDPGTGDEPPGRAGGNVEAIRTVLTAMVGAGGLVTLAVVVRRQWSQEQDHKLAKQNAADARAEADRRHRLDLQSAAEARHDAEERRITDLYMTAVEQLGHDKATVRLGALYALDRLGRNHPGHRREVIEIWCSYLRRSFTPPIRFTESEGAPLTPVESHVDTYLAPSTASHAEAEEEYQVRTTAQRLLVSHFKDPRDNHQRNEPPPVDPEGFWAVPHLGLPGAVLINADFGNCWLPKANFSGTTFIGHTTFDAARFSEYARFSRARFNGPGSFERARFGRDTRFEKTRFSRTARFSEALFIEHADFGGAEFEGNARFDEARFGGDAEFIRARFIQGAEFCETRFDGNVTFAVAQFLKAAGFSTVRFASDVSFHNTRFDDRATFDGVRFRGHVSFGDADFDHDAEFDEAVTTLTSDKPSTWPDGLTVVADTGRPGWGRLERRGSLDPDQT
jgi:uncharacterized protein YjbI with pentapeptide repeats